jgi:membrane fusion protein (multidrug efflux system)
MHRTKSPRLAEPSSVGEQAQASASAPSSAPATGRRRLLLRVGLPVAVLALAGLAYELRQVFTHESTDDAFVDAHISSIAARVEGQVTRVAVDDNQAVQKGDLLAEIDPRDYEVRLDQARANLLAAQAASRRADLDLPRYRRLRRTDDVTQQQLDVAEADAESGRANVLLRQAALRQAELDLSYTRVVAPQDGRVTHRSVEIGDYLKVGQPLLAVVPSQAWVTANFKETQLKHMQPGQPVRMEVDAYPGRVFKGHVDSIQSGTGAQFSLLPPENATGNYVKVVQRIPVKILVDTVDAARPLVPGMSVVPTVQVR